MDTKTESPKMKAVFVVDFSSVIGLTDAPVGVTEWFTSQPLPVASGLWRTGRLSAAEPRAGIAIPEEWVVNEREHERVFRSGGDCCQLPARGLCRKFRISPFDSTWDTYSFIEMSITAAANWPRDRCRVGVRLQKGSEREDD
jgi:hypothetical protein